MVRRGDGPDAQRARRRKLIWVSGLYSAAFFLAAVAIAAGGAALLAWFLAGRGLPFLWTWLVIVTVLLLGPLAVRLIIELRGGGED